MRTIAHVSGRDLTLAQIEANGMSGGQSQTFYMGLLNLLAENGLFDLENSKVGGLGNARAALRTKNGTWRI